MRLKPLDIAVVLGTAALIFWGATALWGGSSVAHRVVISSPSGEWIYPLDADRRVIARGPLGDTLVAIADKSVKVLDSTCKNKICVETGAISSAGQWIACLPNQVFVRIDGDTTKGGVDATTY